MELSLRMLFSLSLQYFLNNWFLHLLFTWYLHVHRQLCGVKATAVPPVSHALPISPKPNKRLRGLWSINKKIKLQEGLYTKSCLGLAFAKLNILGATYLSHWSDIIKIYLYKFNAIVERGPGKILSSLCHPLCTRTSFLVSSFLQKIRWSFRKLDV